MTVLVGPTYPEARPISLMRKGLITASSLGKRPRFWMIFRTAGGSLAADQSQDLLSGIDRIPRPAVMAGHCVQRRAGRRRQGRTRQPPEFAIAPSR